MAFGVASSLKCLVLYLQIWRKRCHSDITITIDNWVVIVTSHCLGNYSIINCHHGNQVFIVTLVH